MTRLNGLQVEILENRCLLSFSPATNFRVDSIPQAVDIADFNNDGRLDLVTSNPSDHSISVLLGDGRGGFGSATLIDASLIQGADRASLAVADFNSDGNLDVATVQYYEDPEYFNHGGLSVLLGNGDGTFQPAFSIVGGILTAVPGDFNADSNPDLLVSADDGNSFGVVQVLLGNGQGEFVHAAPYQINSPANALAVGDINNDGKLDAMMLLANGWTLLGNGDGTFLQPDPWYLYELGTMPGARHLALGEYTMDENLDVVFAGDSIAVHPGFGDGFFDGPINHSSNGSVQVAVATGDFNGDGRLDAVTSDSNSGTLRLMHGNGNGTLAFAGAFAADSAPVAVAVGDFNGDGRPDAVTANTDSRNVSVLLNNGDWPVTNSYLAIHNVSVTEGNAGTSSASFTITRSGAIDQTSTVDFDTRNRTASAGSDYRAASGTLTFAVGEIHKTVTVQVYGDRLAESNESFAVTLSNPTHAIISDYEGMGLILDDESRISISDVTKSEGKSGKSRFTFTVSLAVPYDQAVTISYRTVNGTATSGEDYAAKTGTLTFAPGVTSQTISIEVKGDSKREANEIFYLDLFGASNNSFIIKTRGQGTILNDD